MNNTTYYPGPENVTTPVDMLQYTNSLTEDLFGAFILVGLWMVIFLAQKDYPTEKAFTSASFTTAIASYFLLIMDLVPVTVVLIATILTVVSVFFLYGKQGPRR